MKKMLILIFILIPIYANAEIIKNPDGTVSKVEDSQNVVESYTTEQLPDIDTEIYNTQAAIADIENFKQRRLDNLNARLNELQQYKNLLQGNL